MSTFIESATSRETSAELMEAILAVAGSEQAAERVWEDPSNREALAIWERVTKNGQRSASEFCWGANGSTWANALGIEQ